MATGGPLQVRGQEGSVLLVLFSFLFYTERRRLDDIYRWRGRNQ